MEQHAFDPVMFLSFLGGGGGSDLVSLLQPNWKDAMYFSGQNEQVADGSNGIVQPGEVEVSGFLYVHVADAHDDGAYQRKLITNMHDLGEDLNKDIFAQENASSDRPVLSPVSLWFQHFVISSGCWSVTWSQNCGAHTLPLLRGSVAVPNKFSSAFRGCTACMLYRSCSECNPHSQM
jgi:hypothetical protein